MVSGPHLDADLWGDDGQEGDGQGQGGADLEREWRARRQEHWAGGYREGLEAGKHEAVQGGFDEGEPHLEGGVGALGAGLVADCPWLLQ